MTTEYESQHSYWKRDHDVVMAEIEILKKTDSTWTVIRLPWSPRSIPSWSDWYDWCMNTWGRNDEWVYIGPGTVHFKNEQDAVLFALRWA